MIGGINGRILRFNLSSGQPSEMKIEKEHIETYIGGRGLGARLILQEILPGIDPLGPDNKLIFLTGPLTGTPLTSTGKAMLFTKSPQSGIYLSSMASGFWGEELKYCGWDGLIIEGKAPKPCYLVIEDDKISMCDASHLWGLYTDVTQRIVGEELRRRGAHVAAIGPAGENKVRFAGILMDGRAAARGGGGAVMGSKNLKAIAVKASRREITYYDKKEAIKLIQKIGRDVANSAKTKVFRKLGSGSVMGPVNALGILPTRNYQTGSFESTPLVDAEALRNNYLAKERYLSCPHCAVGCSRLSLVREGPLAGSMAEGPEYESLWSFGPQLENDDLAVIIEADSLCDKLGLDTISAGNVLGFAMECREKGLLPLSLTDPDLRFKNGKAALECLHRIAFRQGIGDLLAEGTREMARRIGGNSADFAMQVKGMELSGYDPRGSKGEGLVYALSSRGGCHHNLGYVVAVESFSGEYDRFATKGKAALVFNSATEQVFYDSVIFCMFARYGTKAKDIAACLEAVTGLSYPFEKLPQFAARVLTLERLFSCREGIRRKDDMLPPRLMKEPLAMPGGHKEVIALDEMLDDYYAIVGWDRDTGVPLPETLEKLGINESFAC